MVFAFVNNTSIRSQAFLHGFGQYVRGNRIWHPRGAEVIAVSSPLVLLDNTIIGRPGGPEPVVRCGTTTTAIGNATTTAFWPIRPPVLEHPEGGEPLLREQRKAYDRDPATEFRDNACFAPGNVAQFGPQPGVLQWNATPEQRRSVTAYAITAPQDLKFAPRDLTLSVGDQPGGPLQVVDVRTNIVWEQPGERRVFTVQAPGRFGAIRLAVSANVAGTAGMRVAEFELLDDAGGNLMGLPGTLVTGRAEPWGQVTLLDQRTLTGPEATTPPAVTLPETPRNHRRKVFAATPGTGDDAAAIQAAIQQAAAEPAGSRPVVHLPKGIWRLARTVVLPPSYDLIVSGDGIGNGTVLESAGGSGPLLLCRGPSRVTLRDLELQAGSTPGVSALVIDGCDQDGGRIYAEQLNANGALGAPVARAIHVDGLDRTEVTMICGGIRGFLSGVVARGGPLAKAGQGGSQVSFVSGASSHGCRLLDVRDGGRLLGETFWYEGNWASPAGLIDLGPESAGELSVAGMSWHMDNRAQPLAGKHPVVRVNGFRGLLGLVGNELDAVDPDTPNPWVHLTGDGGAATVIGIANMFRRAGETFDAAKIWMDDSAPPAKAMMLGSGHPTVVGRQRDAQPDAALVRRALDPLRAARITRGPQPPSGATAVTLLRVQATGGSGGDAVRFQAAPHR